MYDTFITNKTAKLAKEKGFDIPTIGYYIKLKTGWEFQTEDPERGEYNWNEREGRSAPTQAVLQTWLRKRHDYSVEVNYRTFGVESGNGFYYTLMILPKGKQVASRLGSSYYGKDLFNGFKTYEEALEAGLQTILSMKMLSKDNYLIFN